ncbi:MAG: hypothetical protein GTO22_07415 [Gemmatimonadales bacterium]|nr:hypothetical protein [Gemmatimonadales bacterium]
MLFPSRSSVPLLLAAVAAGCATDFPDDPCAAAPGLRAQMQADVAFWTPDHEAALTARLVPGGFGGVYWLDFESRVLAIVLVDVGKSEEAKRAFATALECGAVYAGFSVGNTQFSSIVVREGQYDAIQLLAWKEAAAIAFSDPDVVSLDLDEVRNRIVVGVSAESALERVTDLLIAAGIPRGALIVEVQQPAVPLTSPL